MEKDYVEEVEKKARHFFNQAYKIENLNRIKEINETLSKELFSFDPF